MSPYAEVGDYLIVKEVNSKKIRIDDVITFVNNNVLVTHRIKDIVSEEGNIKFVTQGDSNNILDEEAIYANNVVGKSIIVVPKFGSVIKFISGKIGLTIGITVILLILSLSYKEKEEVRT